MSNWQPMNTIPKDRRVLVKYVAYGYDTKRGEFVPYDEPVIAECWHRGDRLEFWLGDMRVHSTDRPHDPIAWCEVPV